MDVKYVIAGRLRRDTLLPASGKAMIDVPGGPLLQTAVGLSVWDEGCGLLARAGEDYPRLWLEDFTTRGWDTRGVHILPRAMDLRFFQAFQDGRAVQVSNPLAHFARLGLPFPKTLLGYTPPAGDPDPLAVPEDAPHPADIPPDYLDAKAIHICPMDLTTSNRIGSAFRMAGATTLILAPGEGIMKQENLEKTAGLIRGLTAFITSEEELRALFSRRSTDLWEMAAACAGFGCETVVIWRTNLGQYLFDASLGKRWEIPAYPTRVDYPTDGRNAFCGGFLAGYVKTYDPLQAALHGNISASLAMEGSGVFHALEALPGLASRRLDSLADSVRQV